MNEPYTLSTVMPGPPRPRRPRWVIPLLAILAVLLIATTTAAVLLFVNRSASPGTTTAPPTSAAAAAPATTKAYVAPLTLSGTLMLIDDARHWKVGGDCEGEGGFVDIHVGAQVVVLGAAGQIVASGGLIGGLGKRSGSHIACGFGFLIFTVPPGEAFYTLRIGHRDRVLQESELTEDLELTLGE